MRTTQIFLWTVTALASSSLAAQQMPANPNAASAQQAVAPAVPVPSTANVPEVNNADLRPVDGELESKLDSKTAKAGDSVVVKTTRKATIADGIVIPKGSKIVGHVTDVAVRDNSNENTRVTLQFDQAELKGGQNLAIRSVIQSVAPPQGEANQMSAPGLSGGAGAMGSAPGPAGTPGGSGSPVPSQGSGPVVAPNASASQGGTAAVGTVVARNGSVAVRTTAIPGVLLAANADGQPFSNASGALLSARQNVRLDGGTQIVLAVVDAGSKNGR